jgi:integrase
MKESWEKIDFDGSDKLTPKLYKRIYLAAGKHKVRYYAIFTDHQSIRRRMPLGGNFKASIAKIYDLDKKNDNEVDFTEQKKRRIARAMTLGKFVDDYNVTIKSSSHLSHLLAFFGNKPVASICDDDLLAYREVRSKQGIIKNGRELPQLVTQTSVNREISSLRTILRLARTKGYDNRVNQFPMASETPRSRKIEPEEYQTLLSHMPDWLNRAVRFAWETSLSRSDLFKLRWAEIDLNESMIELCNGRSKTGKPQCIPIYTEELRSLIAELHAERKKFPNITDLVLTERGQPLDKNRFEYHFRKACRKAGIENFTLHDIRHCVATRLANQNIPTAAAMLVLGHSSVASHKRYQNLTKTDLKAAFGLKTVHGVFTGKNQKVKSGS